MDKTGIRYFCIGILLFGLCIGFLLVAGCNSSSNSNGSQNTKATMISNSIDFRSLETINYARELVKKSSSGDYNLAQVCDIWEYNRKNWVYINDPNGPDYYSSASNTAKTGLKGDCDDFAIFNAAMVEAIGGTSRVVTATNDEGSGHAFAEVYIGTSEDDAKNVTNYICTRYSCKEIWTNHATDDKGITRYWLNLDWSAGYPGGPYTANNGKKYYYPDDEDDYVKIQVPASPTTTLNVDGSKKILGAITTSVPTPISTIKGSLSSSIYPLIIIKDFFVDIPYKSYHFYYFNGNSGNTYEINIDSTSPVDLLIFDENNFNIYQSAIKLGSTATFKAKIYKSVTSKDVSYILPKTGKYYVVIENSPFLTGGADSKTSVRASTKIDLTGTS